MTADRTTLITSLAIEHLSREEGRIPYVYTDSMGYQTIGVGRLVDRRKGGRLRECEMDFLLGNDIADCLTAMKDWPAWQRVKDDPVRAVAMVSLCFQLGVDGFAAFKNTLAAIAKGAWASAASNLQQSQWARQVPNRAKRVIQMIQTGEMQ